MKLENVKIELLKPYENNPRINDEAVKYVANSIKEFGFKVPIVIDKNYVIVAGHTRYKACLELGFKEIPCIIADDLTDEQIKAFRLADNKVGEKAEWDFEKLNEELEKILNINMDNFGFLKSEEVKINDVDVDEYFTDESNEKELVCPKCGYTGKVDEFL